MRIWVCWFSTNTMRDWDDVHLAFRSKEEADYHLKHCLETEKCDAMKEVELV